MSTAPDKKIFVCAEPEHNKYWIVWQDLTNPRTMLVHNGRLGTNGQLQKPKSFSSDYSCKDEIARKIREKKSKGYKEIDAKQLELLNTQAAIVGSQNKCSILCWVEKTGTTSYVKVNEDRMANPEYDPVLLVELETRKEIGGGNNFTLLFTPEGSYRLHPELQSRSYQSNSAGWKRTDTYSGTTTPITASDPLYEITQKVELSVGRTFCG